MVCTYTEKRRWRAMGPDGSSCDGDGGARGRGGRGQSVGRQEAGQQRQQQLQHRSSPPVQQHGDLIVRCRRHAGRRLLALTGLIML